MSLVYETDATDSPAPALIGGSALGPAMQALTDRQRKFVLALYELPAGRGALTRAAQRAGYGGKPNSMRQIAHALWNNEKVRRAFQEVGYRYIGTTAVAAIQAARDLIFQPDHPDHLKACRMFIDRGWPIETHSHQKIDVAHAHEIHISDTEGAKLARRLAAELGMPEEKLLGWSRMQETKSQLIEATPVEIKGEDDGT
jgi:hypothetical protein